MLSPPVSSGNAVQTWTLLAWHAAVALACLALGIAIGWRHPLSPETVLTIYCAWTVMTCCRPDVGLIVIPACLPFLSLMPWTGWLACDEFDLLVLAWLAGAHARLGLASFRRVPGDQAATSVPVTAVDWLGAALALWTLVGLLRGMLDATAMRLDPFDAYTGAANALRVAKSLLYVALAVAPLRALARRDAARATGHLCAGVLIGFVGVVAICFWERAAFPGLFNFSQRYRVTAMFWEMHVGGAAIDVYVAMAAPLVVWALARSQRPWQWVVSAVLVVAAAYVCLVTYSRGIYAAVLGGLAVIAVVHRLRRAGFGPQDLMRLLHENVTSARWRSRAGLGLVLVVLLEIGLVMGTGTFLSERMGASNRDFGSRMAHWTRGVSLLKTPADWLLGIGLGRLPPRYAAVGSRAEVSGSARLNAAGEQATADPRQGAFVTVSGPRSRLSIGGLYALAQRVERVPDSVYTVSMDVRARGVGELDVSVCERHLLYDQDCQGHTLLIKQPGRAWQHLEFELEGDLFQRGALAESRPAMLTLAVVNPGGIVDVDNVRLTASTGRSLVSNGGFDEGLAHWFPAAQFYFLPWHIDNLYLEWLIEHGVVGLLLFVALAAAALCSLVFGAARALPQAPFLAAALASGLAVGLVSSVMDAPRTAFLLLLLTVWPLLQARIVATPGDAGNRP
jgi:hypothetical protein